MITTSLRSFNKTDSFVSNYHFGGNAVYGVNIADDGWLDGFEDAIDLLGVTHLRFPAGATENVIDVTKLLRGELRPEVRAFMDDIVSRNKMGEPTNVIFVLPTKTIVDPLETKKFIKKLMAEYGDIVFAFEIGNEYSIGEYRADFDFARHPEAVAGDDFASSISEETYGQRASDVIEAIHEAFDELAKSSNTVAEPKIFVQAADFTGSGSSYKGTADYRSANTEILSNMSDLAKSKIDGAIVHYYFNKSISKDYQFDHDITEERRIRERLEDFELQLGREIEYSVTEWNVLKRSDESLGAMAPSTILEMFDTMIAYGVDSSFVWPLQHNTANALAGKKDALEASLTMSGATFQLLKSATEEKTLSDGSTERYRRIDGDWTNTGDFEVYSYQNFSETVLFVSSRSVNNIDLSLDISALSIKASIGVGTTLTFETGSSDGLSDYPDKNGGSRLRMRDVTQAELSELRKLPFFDDTNPSHLKDSGGGQFRTYLPNADTIYPKFKGAKDVNDFFFFGESDVRPELGGENYEVSNGKMSINLRPFEVEVIRLSNNGESVGANISYGNTSDSIVSGSGFDTINSSGGNDTIYAGGGDDVIRSSFGWDNIFSAEGNDYVVAAGGNDFIELGSGDDTVRGGVGLDTIFGDDGDDHIKGDPGHDSIFGGNGGDTIFGNAGSDTIYGNDGNDWVDAGINHDLVYGGGGDDEIYGNNGSDEIYGNAGDDVIFGNAGNDTIDGGDGKNLLHGGIGADVFVFSRGETEILDFQAGIDQLELELSFLVHGGDIENWAERYIREEFGSLVFDFGEAGQLTVLGHGLAEFSAETFF